MTQKAFPISAEFMAAANTTPDQYLENYKQSTEASDAFWAERAKLIDWIKEPTKVSNVNYDLDNFNIKWFEDGELNISVNCLGLPPRIDNGTFTITNDMIVPVPRFWVDRLTDRTKQA